MRTHLGNLSSGEVKFVHTRMKELQIWGRQKSATAVLSIVYFPPCGQ